MRKHPVGSRKNQNVVESVSSKLKNGTLEKFRLRLGEGQLGRIELEGLQLEVGITGFIDFAVTPKAAASVDVKPRWDNQTGDFYLGDQWLCKFAPRAVVVRQLLVKFQSDGWPLNLSLVSNGATIEWKRKRPYNAVRYINNQQRVLRFSAGVETKLDNKQHVSFFWTLTGE